MHCIVFQNILKGGNVFIIALNIYVYIYIIYMYIYIYVYVYIFTTEGLFEVAIENWPEWDLNPQPLNSALLTL